MINVILNLYKITIKLKAFEILSNKFIIVNYYNIELTKYRHLLSSRTQVFFF